MCNYTWSYKAYYEDIELHESSISDICKLLSDELKFECQSTIPDREYEITLKGSLSDEITTAETIFTVKVKPLETLYTVQNEGPSLPVSETYKVER